MISALSNCEPLSITYNGIVLTSPLSFQIDILNDLINSLELVIEDWERETNEFQKKIDAGTKVTNQHGKKLPFTFESLQAFDKIQPIFIKCFFSYTCFFTAIDNLYNNLCKEFSEIEKYLQPHKYFRSRPKKNSNLEKLVKIRNASFTHVQPRLVTKNKGLNPSVKFKTLAYINWKPFSLTAPSNSDFQIKNIMMFAGKLTRREPSGEIIDQIDLELPPLADIHIESTNYFKQLDAYCIDYLLHLKQSQNKT